MGSEMCIRDSVSALNGLTIQEGDKVEYVEEEGNKGKQASQIALL